MGSEAHLGTAATRGAASEGESSWLTAPSAVAGPFDAPARVCR
jgi:hypothetical protein